jgi:hypothetical protein
LLVSCSISPMEGLNADIFFEERTLLLREVDRTFSDDMNFTELSITSIKLDATKTSSKSPILSASWLENRLPLTRYSIAVNTGALSFDEITLGNLIVPPAAYVAKEKEKENICGT